MPALTCKTCGRPLPMFRFTCGKLSKDSILAPPRCQFCHHPKNRGKVLTATKQRKAT